MTAVWIVLGVFLFLLLVFAVAGFYMFKMLLGIRRGEPIDPEKASTPYIKQYWQQKLEDTAWIKAQNYEKISIRSFDGLSLQALLITAPEPSKRYLVAVHGITSSGMREFASLARMYQDLGWNVLMIDNRMHGDSEGKYVGFGVLDKFDVRSWCIYLNERFGEEIELVLHGISMGAAAVMQMSALELPANIRGIVSDCGFSDAKALFKLTLKKTYHLPFSFPFLQISFLFCRLIAGYDMNQSNSPAALSKTDIPFLFIHGTQDELVPYEMGVENYESCRSKKQFVSVEGAKHAVSYGKDPALYRREVQAFLKECGCE